MCDSVAVCDSSRTSLVLTSLLLTAPVLFSMFVISLINSDGTVNAFVGQMDMLPGTMEVQQAFEDHQKLGPYFREAFRQLQALVEADLTPIQYLQPPVSHLIHLHPWQMHFQQDSVLEFFKDGRRLADTVVELAELGTLPRSFFARLFSLVDGGSGAAIDA